MAISTNETRGNAAFKKALRLLSSEGLNGAMMVVERELENNPESWEAWSAKADILYFREQYETALQCCETALRKNPDNALALNTKGNIFYKRGQYNEAIECYNLAIELEPLLIRAWYNKKLASELQLKKSRPTVRYLASRESRKRTR